MGIFLIYELHLHVLHHSVALISFFGVRAHWVTIKMGILVEEMANRNLLEPLLATPGCLEFHH